MLNRKMINFEPSLQLAFQRVAQLGELGPDWDSYGAAPPAHRAIATAYGLLLTAYQHYERTVGERIRPYAIVPVADGGVQLDWRGPAAEIEVEIDPTGSIGYLYIDRRGAARTFKEENDVRLSTVIALIGMVVAPEDNG
jgi:hypothetical protein